MEIGKEMVDEHGKMAHIIAAGGMPCAASLLMQKKVQETMNEDT